MNSTRARGFRVRLTVLVALLVGCLAFVAAPMGSGGLTIPQMLQERNLSSAHASPLGRTAAGQSSSVTMRPTSPSTAQAATTSSSVLSRFGPLYMGSQQSYTQAEAVAYAQEFTLIAQRSGEFTPYLAAMKAANPALRVVAYMNGAFDQSTAGNAYPLSWYARDAKGNRIQSNAFGNWLMNPGASWGSAVASKCTTLISQSKYDGCFLDTMGLGPLLPGYVTGVPINPATNAAYTATAWIAAQSSTVSTVEAANRGAVIVTNGLANGPKYFSPSGPTEPLLATSKIAMAEIWLRASANAVTKFPSAQAWKEDVDMLASAEASGWSVMVTTKLWTTASAAQQSAWHKFALASFLLGTGGRCAFSFSTSSTDSSLTATTSWDTVAVGMPSGPYTTSGLAYERTFSHGLAVVNPGSTSVTIKLAKPYVNLDGLTVTSETLSPETGDVFVG